MMGWCKLCGVLIAGTTPPEVAADDEQAAAVAMRELTSLLAMSMLHLMGSHAEAIDRINATMLRAGHIEVAKFLHCEDAKFLNCVESSRLLLIDRLGQPLGASVIDTPAVSLPS